MQMTITLDEHSVNILERLDTKHATQWTEAAMSPELVQMLIYLAMHLLEREIDRADCRKEWQETWRWFGR